MKHKMDCKEFEKLIPYFIENKLDYKKTKSFIEHVETCKDCREELTIQFLITEGLARLEDGGAFDLQKELDKQMELAQRGLRRHNTMKYLSIVMEILAAAAVGIIIWLIV